MNKLEFETKLNDIYSGTVKPLNSYLNEHSTQCFKCAKCGVVFFGKASHIVGEEHRRHVCYMPYGDISGERLLKAGNTKHSHKKSKKSNGDKFYKMVIEDYTPFEIHKEMHIPYKLVLDYFKDQGLI